ncbi:expressed unknown protein [Seminavis robusta]|uniref:Uncharacterized protein n=1 Tax=Seminavis robusta TaxID=568900 RepID=A0A9N8DEY9_9STRA|nr:expressed unknown protein [Seminavis robusta]|eukprot:Sro111_g055431.1  (161) ;mRNA; r:108569-109051
MDLMQSIVKYATLLIASFNIVCGSAIVGGHLLPRDVVPNMIESSFGMMMDTTGSTTIVQSTSSAERLYNIVFGLLALQLGLVRVLGVWYWQQAPHTCIMAILATTFLIEFARDGTMIREGLIGLDEAVAFFPSAVLMAAYLGLVVASVRRNHRGEDKKQT